VDARVVAELGVEGGGHDSSLADGDGIFIFALGGEDFHARADTFDLGSADENHLDWRLAELLFDKSAFADGAVDLSAVGIAADGDVNCSEAFLSGIFNFICEQDGAGAGAERWLHTDELLQLLESGFAEQLEERARLAAGDDQAVDFLELFGLFNEHNFSAQLLEPFAVGVKIALEGKNTDFHKNL